MKFIITTLVGLCAFAYFPSYGQDDIFDVTIEEESTDYQWKTPAGEYLDPTSFFSLHGYVNGLFAGKSKDWNVADPTQLGPPGQLLVPNTANSSFQYDFALIVASELSSRTRLAIETHYVSDPSGKGAAGPGGLTIAITEAAVSYDLIPKYFTLSGGLFWSPFGIVNNDWLGAQNNFSLIPRASGAYPVHFNERGVRLNGFFEMGDNAAINYVVSFGNGVSNYNISGQSSYDRNNGKTLTGRIGIFPGLGKDLDIGVSFMSGTLRNTEDDTRLPADIQRYESETSVFGIDASYNKGDIELRGYYISGTESLTADMAGNAPDDIERTGTMVEIAYAIPVTSEHFLAIQPKFRFDKITIDNLEENGSVLLINTYDTNTLSFGTNILINDNFRFSFDHNLITENGQNELSNNRFVAKVIANF